MAEPGALSFGGLLRQLRVQARLTQEELAEAAGVSPRSVSDLERGVNRTARKDTAALLADALALAGPGAELFVAAARGKTAPAAVLAVISAEAASPGGVTASPYRGLRMFEEQDAPFFFGREAAALEVLGRMSQLLAGAGLLVVSGVSGAGKSSLLRAGVLPRLRVAGLAAAPEARLWPWVVFTPTGAPLDELALRVAPLAGTDAATVRRGLEADPEGFALTARQAALGGSRGRGEPLMPAAGPGQPLRRRLLLVVDQFEELFTQCDQERQRRSFIAALDAAVTAGPGPDRAPAAMVVLAVRADFEARCADYPLLAGPVQGRYLVTAMSERQLRMVITEPAKKAGARVDDDLAGVLLAQMRNGEPGAFGAGVLPLLSHALDQAWRHRAGETVTLPDYEQTGGLEGAVAASAQRVYDALTAGQQATARQVFTWLVAGSGEGMDIARRAVRAELTEGKTASEAAAVEAVLEAFAAERLLTLAAETVELSHEVLLTSWPLLRDTWLAETHADRIVRTRLHNSATEWIRHRRDPSYLYSGSLLQVATSTAARIGADPIRHPPLSATEQDFLRACQRAHQRRSRRRRALLASLVVLIIGLASAAGLAIRASQQAADQRDIRILAVSDLLMIESRQAVNARHSLLLSIAAWRLHRSVQARLAMLAAAAQGQTRVIFTGHVSHAGHPVYSVALSPDGKTLATGNADGTVDLWDMATRQLTAVLRCPKAPGLYCPAGPVDMLEFDPSGKPQTLASGGATGTQILWSLETRRPIGSMPSHALRLTAAALSPDRRTVAVGSASGQISLRDIATRQLITVLHPAGRASRLTAAAFSPDGETLASISADGRARVWDVSYLTDTVARLCALAGPPFTPSQWQRYVPPGTPYVDACP